MGNDKRRKRIEYKFSEKHKAYIRKCKDCMYNIAEGAIRAGKTVDNVFAFAHELKTTPDKLHLATGSTLGNAKLNIGDANGYGLEYIFKGQCRWGKYKGNECLYINGPDTGYRERVVIFAGGKNADSYKKIHGNSYGMWIATEINLHHDKMIKEGFGRTLAAARRKIFWDLNPDNPRAQIYTAYIDKYDKQNAEGKLLGGYNYEHFTIDDNITITPQRIAEIKSQYDPNSIWYMQDILGKRVAAEGIIYRRFATDTNSEVKTFAMTNKPTNLMKIVLGVDFGGNGSGHAFSATGITRGWGEVITLAAEWIDCSTQEDIDPDKLGWLFVDFCLKIINQYGTITAVYADNAEPTLIAGLKSTLRKAGLGWIRVDGAAKIHINSRINATNRLMAQGRFYYVDGQCEPLVEALCTAVWDPKKITENVRLDDGTSNIDSLDAFEYTIERDINMLIRVE